MFDMFDEKELDLKSKRDLLIRKMMKNAVCCIANTISVVDKNNVCTIEELLKRMHESFKYFDHLFYVHIHDYAVERTENYLDEFEEIFDLGEDYASVLVDHYDAQCVIQIDFVFDKKSFEEYKDCIRAVIYYLLFYPNLFIP